jgi:hypothetical protein
MLQNTNNPFFSYNNMYFENCILNALPFPICVSVTVFLIEYVFCLFLTGYNINITLFFS